MELLEISIQYFLKRKNIFSGQWRGKEAQQYLQEKLGMASRQLSAKVETNRGTIYEGRVTGDSPELCRALDSHGFSHLETAINFNVAISSFLPYHDPRCMHLGTPRQVMDTMVRCWQFSPTSEQICADIRGFRFVLDKIVNAEGIIVKGEGLRHGRRQVRHDNKGLLTTRLRNSQRKASLALAPVDRLLQPILDGITSRDGDINESIARLLLEFEAINDDQDLIEDQDVVDDLLDDIEEGDEVEEARRDLADDL
jgi:hypothetical protein